MRNLNNEFTDFRQEFREMKEENLKMRQSIQQLIEIQL